MKTNFLTNLGSGNTNNGGSYSGLSSPIESDKTNDNGRLLPLTSKVLNSEDSTIEYGKKFLPPIWVDIHEEIERHFEDLHIKSI